MNIMPEICRKDGKSRLLPILLLFLSALICALLFFSTGAWAQISHDDLTCSIVENHTFRIDRFITDAVAGQNTGDWAFYDGHYYSNKAPGTSFLGAAFYFPVYAAEKALAAEISPAVAYFNCWWIHFFVSVFPFAFGCVLFFLTFRKLGCSAVRAAILAEVASFATPLWAYSSSTWAHPLAATCLLLSFYTILCAALTDRPSACPRLLAIAGCACGCAFLCDYGCGAVLPVFVLGVLFQFRKKAVPFFLGALPPAILFAWYHWICFGSPFTIASFYNNPIFTESTKTGGIFGAFSSFIMLKLLIGSERGIFWSAPVLLAVFPGLCSFWKQGGARRKISVFLAAWILSGLLANSAFNGWHGGSTICARYLIFTVPAFCIAFAGCEFKRLLACVLFAALALFSWGNMLVINAVTPFCSDGYNPLYLNAYPLFFCGYSDLAKPVVCGTFSDEYNAIPMLSKGILSPGRVIGGGAVTDILFPFVFAAIPLLVNCRGNFRTWILQLRKSLSGMYLRITSDVRKFTALLLCALFVFLLYPLDIIWVNDEPSLLLNALMYSQNGAWCPHGLVGSFGVSYGPFPTWIYQILLMLSQNLPTVAVLKTLLYSVSCFLLLYALAKESRIPPVIPVVFFLLSPWLRNYARCLWDNIFLVPLSLAFLLCIMKILRTGSKFALVCAALLSIICVSVHSMAAPLIGGTALFFLIFHRKFLRQHFFACALCAIPAAFFSAFILLNRFFAQSGGGSNSFGGADSDILMQILNLLQFTTLLSPLRFCAFYIPDGLPVAWLPAAFLAVGVPVFFLLLVFAVNGLNTARFAASLPRVNLARLSICILLTHILFFGLMRIRMYPHYHMAAVMPYLALASCGAYSITRKFRKYRNLWYWIPLPSLCLSLCFAIAIHSNAGTRDIMTFGPTLAYQWQTVALLNQQISTGATLNLRYDPAVIPFDTFPLSLDVLREYEDIAHPREYPDVPETEPLPFVIAPPILPSVKQ